MTQTIITPEMIEAAEEAYMPFGDMHLAIQAALAAAPQPPEAIGLISEKRTTKTEAAPEAKSNCANLDQLNKNAALAAQVPKGWKLVPDEANMTDEQAEAICRLANVCGGGAYGIYRAALEAAPQPADAWPVAADPAQQPSADDFLKELAALRDLFPVPKIGSSHETRWMAAISNPSEVLTYVINMVRELLAGKALAAALLRATQRHLPPENIGAHETIAEIISIVDPWPLAKPPANET